MELKNSFLCLYGLTSGFYGTLTEDTSFHTNLFVTHLIFRLYVFVPSGLYVFEPQLFSARNNVPVRASRLTNLILFYFII
jgi:hypothetical protein